MRRAGGRLGRAFGWLWASYAVSALGTGLAFSAFPLVAILVLHAGAGQVSALAAVGLAAGAALAVPLGPWVDARRKRPVMMAMDLVRFAALATVPAAFALGVLSFAQLLAVSVITGAADITFKAASGACVKSLVAPEDLLIANGRLESTLWTATVLGPPLGGAAIGLLGPVTTMVADGASYLLSAAGLRAIGPACDVAPPPRPARSAAGAGGGLLDGWRHILASPVLRPLLLNAMTVNGLIMATEPLLAVLMLDRLGFAPWQYGLAFAVPCLGGLACSRLAARLAARFGRQRLLLASGTLRACWLAGLPFTGRGPGGLAWVMAVELGLICSCGVFNPVLATVRLDQSPPAVVSRVLAAWSVSTKAAIAVLTALWGLLATVTSIRIALAAAGVALLATPLLLPRHLARAGAEPEPAPSAVTPGAGS